MLASLRVLWIAFCLLGPAAAQANLERVLQQVAGRLDEQKEELPDFVCRETVLIRTWYAGGGDRTQVRGNFEFRVSQRSGEERRPLEERDERIQQKVITLGGAFSALYGVLGGQNASRWDFDMRRKGGSLHLSATVPAEESKTTIRTQNGEVALGYKAEVEIDQASHQPLRMERVAQSEVGSLEYLKHILVYDEFQFGDESFYLPKKQTTLLRFGATWYQARHEYDDCKQFIVRIQ